jgi:serine/threonine protein kinase
MKLCPQCNTGYPDSHTNCPIHGGYLSEIIDLKPGMLIRNTYRIVRKLGEGGMGSVYLAEHTLMDEQRALKFLSRQWSRDEGFIARFRREARTLHQVRHKNVVDSGDLELAEDGTLFFSMEFVQGPDLLDFLHNAPKPFDVGQALALTRGIAEGLGAAHAKGMVHRDIKPENILMAREDDGWIPKIADFGIVATKESSIARTQTGGSLLTPLYAAPEQWRGMRAVEMDGRTDLYALGGVLFKMLTGRIVFDADSYEGWAEQHRNIAPQAPSRWRPELADWKGLDALVLRLLAKNREDRPRNVAEFLRELDRVVKRTPPPPTLVYDRRQETVPEFKHQISVQDRRAGRGAGEKKEKIAEPELFQQERTKLPRILYVLLALAGICVAGIAGYNYELKSSAPPPGTSPFFANNTAPVSQDTDHSPTHGHSPTPAHAPLPGAPAPASLTVECDSTCAWKLDGKDHGRIEAGQSASVSSLSEGSARVEAETVDGCSAPQTKQLTARSGDHLNAGFNFQTAENSCRQQLSQLMQMADTTWKIGDPAAAAATYSKMMQSRMPSAMYEEAKARKNKILADCRNLGISCEAGR